MIGGEERADACDLDAMRWALCMFCIRRDNACARAIDYFHGHTRPGVSAAGCRRGSHDKPSTIQAIQTPMEKFMASKGCFARIGEAKC